MIGLLVFVVGLAFWISTHGTTTRHMVSIMLSGRVVRVAQAESAFHARYGRIRVHVRRLGSGRAAGRPPVTFAALHAVIVQPYPDQRPEHSRAIAVQQRSVT